MKEKKEGGGGRKGKKRKGRGKAKEKMKGKKGRKILITRESSKSARALEIFPIRYNFRVNICRNSFFSSKYL